MRRPIDNELAILHRYLSHMTALVNEQFTEAVRALVTGDVPLAETVRRRDDEVDRLEILVDGECERLLALFQPVANDLRMLITAIKINTDLERIADHCKNLAKSTSRLAAMPNLVPHARLEAMAASVRMILNDALQAFLKRDVELARRVLAADREVDALHRENFGILVGMCKEDPELAEPVARLIIAGKGLERIADHATNIAEEVIFLIEGLDVRHRRVNLTAKET